MKNLREVQTRLLIRRLNQLYDVNIATTLPRYKQIELYKDVLLDFSMDNDLRLDCHDISCFLANHLPKVDCFKNNNPAA